MRLCTFVTIGAVIVELFLTAGNAKVESALALPAATVTSIDFLSEKEGWVATDDGVWLTLDSGRRWRSLVLPPAPHHRIVEIHALSPSRAWMLDDGRWYTTSDGKSWQIGPAVPIRNGFVVGMSWDITMNLGWALCGKRIQPEAPPEAVAYRTKDGGKHWIRIELPALGENVKDCAF